MLCASGLATMAELLDPRGPWSFSLIELMIPRAVEIELGRLRQMSIAVKGAVGSLFSKDVEKSFKGSLSKSQETIDKATGKTTAKKAKIKEHAKAATDFMSMLSGLNLKKG